MKRANILLSIVVVIGCVLLFTSCREERVSSTDDSNVFLTNETDNEKKNNDIENEVDEDVMPYKVHHYEGFCFVDEDSLLVFDSRQAMEEYCDENGYPFFKGEVSEGREEIVYRNSEMSRKIRSYDEDYFEKKSIVIVSFCFPTVCSARFETIKEEVEELTICIMRLQPEGSASLAISQHTFIFEIDKQMIANKTIKVDISTQDDTNDYDDGPTPIAEPFAKDEKESEDKQELPFSEDTILVVLTSKATLTFKKYTAEDFAGLGVISVEDLSESAREKLYDQLYGDDPSKYKKNWMINKNAFRTILCLTLEHKGEEAIFNAIEKLMKREDVESAEPNFKIYPESTGSGTLDYSKWG